MWHCETLCLRNTCDLGFSAVCADPFSELCGALVRNAWAGGGGSTLFSDLCETLLSIAYSECACVNDVYVRNYIYWSLACHYLVIFM